MQTSKTVNKFVLKVVFIIFGILFYCIGGTYKAFAVQPVQTTVPSGSYYFSGSGELSDSKHNVKSGLLNSILKGKQEAVLKEFEEMDKKGYKSTDLTVNLDGDINGWTVNTLDLYMSKKDSIVTMSDGKKEYKIFIPRGATSSGVMINQTVINCSIKGLEQFQASVKDGIIGGSIAVSKNIYTMYPDRQVPLSDILKVAKDNNGVNKDYYEIKASSSANITYETDYLYHPILGKLDSKKVPKDEKAWRGAIKSSKLPSPSNGKMTLKLDKDFSSFMTGKDAGVNMLAKTDIDKNSVKFTCAESKKECKAVNYIDSAFRIAVPKTFTEKINKKFHVKQKDFTIIKGTKFVISRRLVYEDKKGTLTKLGDYASFNIGANDLALYYAEVNGKKVGVVVPLKFKEVVRDPSSSQDYLTGRDILLSNDYSGKLELDTANRDLMSVKESASGVQSTKARFFAFNVGADYKDANGHSSVKPTASSFEFVIDFAKSKELKGFVIYRNNAHIKDESLINWLGSSLAQALTDVKAQELLDKIQGKLDITDSKLTYEEWKRIEQIEAELDRGLSNSLVSFVRILLMIFGVFIIIYGVTLVMAHLFDSFNSFIDIDLLKLITRGRLVAIPMYSPDNLLEKTHKASDGVTYVTIWRLLLIVMICIAIGLIFIFTTPILQFLVKMYVVLSGLFSKF